ncbi:phospholipase A1 VesT1.02 [Anabrus simplex]|uniref:phospholipase A1 VesT1.02 n=1 Tax=Anabrus simplex TaxID=316456 RepID=UPI0035A3C20D
MKNSVVVTLLLLSAVVCLAAAIRHRGADQEGRGLRSGPLVEALNLGNTSTNASRADCVWRRGMDRDPCPDPDIKYFLYTSADPQRRSTLSIVARDWLRLSGWDPNHDNVFIIHGYAGGDHQLPVAVLREAYLKNGSYNVFTVDWGTLARAPCYPAAVHNMRTVARCMAGVLTFLRDSGLPVHRTTCVGHSLGAHICGLLAGYLNFRLHRIIGLDPARPLVRNQNKLNGGDAGVVHVIHTNAGRYGEPGRLGHVDFCVNGGRMQPFCENKTHPELCSHARSVCYLAESINTATSRLATPCSRRCPTGFSRREGARHGDPILMGEHTPTSAAGSFCLSNTDEPYCPKAPGQPGDPRCCSELLPAQAQLGTDGMPSL